WPIVAGHGIHSGGTRTMFSVGFSEVTRTHTAGKSQAIATITRSPVSSTRHTRADRLMPRSILRVAAQATELEQRDQEDHGDHHPRNGRGGAEVEEVLEAGLVEMLDDRTGRVARSPAGEHEDLAEDLERADDVRHEHEEEHGAEQRHRDRPEAPP